jgi:hypothetical protein
MAKALDMNQMQRSSRDARDEAEATALAKVDGKKRLRKNRTEAMTIRLSPQRRAQLVRLSDALGVAFVDTIEQALDALDAKLKGSR